MPDRGNQTIGIQGITLRIWWPNQVIQGLWGNEADNHAWTYASARGWLKVNGASVLTGAAMLQELAAAKAGSRPVDLFEDRGVVVHRRATDARSPGATNGQEYQLP